MSDGRRGSVKQAANGTWGFIVDIGGAGERKQTRRRGFPSRKTAQAELTRILGTLEQRTYVAPARQTLGQFLTDVWLPAIEHTVKPSTHASYARTMRLHVVGRPIGRRQVQQLSGSDLNALYAQLLAGDGGRGPLGTRSVQYVATILHRACKDAMKWQAIVRNPVEASDPPRSSAKREMSVWQAQEVGAFLTGAAGDRLAGAWWLLATTGMRRGEALGLRWSDIDLDAGHLDVVRTLITADVQRKGSPGYAWGTPKTAKGRRRVALDAGTVTALRAHRARQLEERLALGEGYVDEDLVVCQPDGSPVNPKTLSWYFERVIKRLGLPRIRLHDLRHTHATLALRAGVHPRVVQERLGHANVSITLDTYSHVDLDMQAAAAARVAALLGTTS